MCLHHTRVIHCRCGALTTKDLVIPSSDDIMGREAFAQNDDCTPDVTSDANRPLVDDSVPTIGSTALEPVAVPNLSAPQKMHADLPASHDTSTELGYEELHKRKQRVQRFKETHQGTMVKQLHKCLCCSSSTTSYQVRGVVLWGHARLLRSHT